MPPPSSDVLLLTVELMICKLALPDEQPRLQMPPPNAHVPLPNEHMPAPDAQVAELPFTAQLLTVNVALSLRMPPPPGPAAAPLLIVRLEMLTVLDEPM